MNVWLGITLEVLKGGLQIYIQMKAYVIKGGRKIYIQMKAYVLPFKNIISVGTNQHYLVKKYK